MSSDVRPEEEIPPVSGLVAGKYELVKLIGRGGMGSVWEGRHTSLGKRVAIKFIEAEYANSNEARSRFDNEARAAASLQSKHAIEIYDHGVTETGRPYIVMELLLGEPLDKRIDRLGRLSLPDTARILQQVCRALQRAHDAGIIHRDLKPENIFLVRAHEEDDEIAKVLDFGIAKIQPPPGQRPGQQGVSSSTKTGAVLGTPYYMSPEQARGLRNVDHRTDLWSLGVIAYKCITGVLPFEGESVGDLLVKICTSPLPVPSQLYPGIPVTFDAWFFRALDREPMRRFGSAQELSEGLAFACGVSVRRGPTSSSPNAYASTAGAGPMSGHAGPGHYPGQQAAQRAGQHAGQPSYRQPGMSTTPATPASAAYAQSGAGGPGMTAAPFVNSARPAKSSRGVIVASIGAALVGVSVGAFAIVKFAGAPHVPDSRSNATPASLAATATESTAAGTASDPAIAIATALPTSSATTTATTTTTTAATSTAGMGKYPFRPAPSAKASASAAPTTPIVSAKPALPSPSPPPPPPKPTSADPGY